jgi:hypothetical protein
MNARSSLMPDVAEFTSGNEVIVWITPGQVPDSMGRVQFAAFWLAPACIYGVRGQVFNTELTAFVAREQAAGYSVTVMQEADRG